MCCICEFADFTTIPAPPSDCTIYRAFLSSFVRLSFGPLDMDMEQQTCSLGTTLCWRLRSVISLAREEIFKLKFFWQYFVVAQLLYLIAQLAAKISVALVLYRIATMAPMIRRILIGSMSILSIVSIAAIFIFAFQCRPLSVAWGVGTGTCLPGSAIANTAYAVSAADILFSWLYGVSSVRSTTRLSCG